MGDLQGCLCWIWGGRDGFRNVFCRGTLLYEMTGWLNAMFDLGITCMNLGIGDEGKGRGFRGQQSDGADDILYDPWLYAISSINYRTATRPLPISFAELCFPRSPAQPQPSSGVVFFLRPHVSFVHTLATPSRPCVCMSLTTAPLKALRRVRRRRRGRRVPGDAHTPICFSRGTRRRRAR